jgi:hypothetical protein
VSHHDAVAGGHERLSLNRLVAVAGVQDLRAQPRIAEHPVQEAGGRTAVGSDPRLARQLGGPDRLRPGEGVPGRDEQARRVAKERDQLYALGCGVRLEGVLEDDRHVELRRRQTPECRGPVDQLILDHVGLIAKQLGMACLEQRPELCRQVHERREERPQTNVARAQAGEVRDLSLRDGEPSEDHLGVLHEHGAAPAADHGSPAAAIAAVTTVGYLGSFTGPPLVGALAEAGSLTAALGLLVVVSGAMVLLAPRLPG